MNWSKVVSNFTDDAMNISGREIPLKRGKLSHGELSYWQSNPRIYSIVHASETPLEQSEIELELLSRDHVKQLIKDIKHHGGLIDPIIVIDESFQVIEGNSRLAAVRYLTQNDPVRFGKIACNVLPADTDDDVIYSYLNQEHLQGKTHWSPYEQAGVIYRLVKSGRTIDSLRVEMNISKQKANKMFSVYQFMVEHGEDKPSRYSYYDVYLGTKKAMTKREIEPRLDDKVVHEIRRGNVTAQEFRKILPMVCSNDNQFNRFLTGKSSLVGAFEDLEEQGKTEDLVRRLKRIQDQLTSMEKGEFDRLNAKAQKVAQFCLKRIQTRIQVLRKQVYDDK